MPDPMRVLLIAGLLAGLAGPARSQALCSMPLPPTCADYAPTYEDGPTTERCRQELDQFGQDMKDYLSCLEKEVEQTMARADALREYFECRAAGREDCQPPHRR